MNEIKPKLELVEWKEIENHPMYEVSNLGEIRSWKNGKHGKADKPKVLKLFDNGGGYSCVRIDNKTYRINILVLNAFEGLKSTSTPICRHIDSNKKNNYLTNLEWSSYKQNYQDRKDLGLGNEGSKHGNYKHGKYSKSYIQNKIVDMPKIESPFKRKLNKNNNYIVYDEIAEGMQWVFEDDSVMAIEKLHGTNVSILIQEGTVTAIFNRTERIPFITKGKRWIIEAMLESKSRGYLEFLGDGQHFGEVIGPKVNGNPYNLTEHIWIPFSNYAQEHLKYKSWGKYPKNFKTISDWFKDDLIPLFASMRGNREDGFVEGIVFTHPDGRMAKLRRNMFDWYSGSRHNDKYNGKGKSKK